MESVVLILLSDGSNEVVLLSDLSRLHNLSGRPLRRSPVIAEIKVPYTLRKALNDLLHRRADVRAMSEHDVHVRLLQAGQRALQALDDVLAGETAGVGLLAASAEEDLRGEHVLVTRPVELLERLSHFDFALAIGVDLGGVEEVDAVVPGSLKAVLDDLALLGAAVGEPAAEREDGDLQSSGPEVAELLVDCQWQILAL